MANVHVTSDPATHLISNAAAPALINSDTINNIFVASGGLIVNTSTGSAVRLGATTGAHGIVIHGDVRATSGEGLALSPATAVTVVQGGLVSSNGTGILAQQNLTLNNAGTVTGARAMQISGDSGTILNSGDIFATSTTLSAILFDGAPINAALNTILNTGLISSASPNAIQAAANSAGLQVTNLGQILGGITSASVQAADSVVNAGLIRGNIDLGGGTDTYDARQGGIVQGGVVGLGAGNDTFFGSGFDEFAGSSLGNDSFDFGAGNDTFLAGTTDGNDTVNGGAGTDTYDASAASVLNTSVTINLAAGTASGAQIGSDTITGFENAFGTLGNDTLIGNALANILQGSGGSDTIDGRGAGSDILNGLDGNDSYVIDAGDTIVEFSGIDLVQSSAVSLNLAALGGGGIENAKLLGAAALAITGNALANVVTGNLGRNVLTGGGAGDTFVFSTALATARADRITDFNVPQDIMHLENTGAGLFTGLAAGALAATRFKANTTGTATDADDRIVYNKTTGDLFFDANGSGAGGAIKFATLANKAALTAADFFVI